jgi:hypothetical protein
VWSREDWFISTTQRFPGPPSRMFTADGGQVLGIGIDWAEDFHDIALGTQEKGVIEQFRIDHGPAGAGGRQSRGEWVLSCDDTRS